MKWFIFFAFVSAVIPAIRTTLLAEKMQVSYLEPYKFCSLNSGRHLVKSQQSHPLQQKLVLCPPKQHQRCNTALCRRRWPCTLPLSLPLQCLVNMIVSTDGSHQKVNVSWLVVHIILIYYTFFNEILFHQKSCSGHFIEKRAELPVLCAGSIELNDYRKYPWINMQILLKFDWVCKIKSFA